MQRLKICIIGAGSVSWGPTLLRDIVVALDLPADVALHDLDVPAMTGMCEVGRRMVAEAQADIQVDTYEDLREALDGSDFVVVTITTGGLEAMRLDLDVPGAHGIHQTVGDTVGPGGLARALRNIPVLVSIAHVMEEVCPDAWMLNLTNPMTTLTRAVAKSSSIPVVGLCHEYMGVRHGLARALGVAVNEVKMGIAGINHMTWCLDLWFPGKEGRKGPEDWKDLAARFEGYQQALPPEELHGSDGWGVKLRLLEEYGYLAAAGDRHISEFFPDVLTRETDWGQAYRVYETTIEHRIHNMAVSQAEVDGMRAGDLSVLGERSDEQVVDVIAGIARGRQSVVAVNLPNRGQIDNLPRDAVVETLGVVDRGNLHGLAMGTLPQSLVETIANHVYNQELTVEAALQGDRKLALQALRNDPLVGGRASARSLLDDLLSAHRDLLPQFRQSEAKGGRGRMGEKPVPQGGSKSDQG